LLWTLPSFTENNKFDFCIGFFLHGLHSIFVSPLQSVTWVAPLHFQFPTITLCHTLLFTVRWQAPCLNRRGSAPVSPKSGVRIDVYELHCYVRI
jgi:hypothetical protein